MYRIAVTILALAALLGLATTASVAGVPRLINYQGVLTDAAGAAIEGTHTLTFKVYTDSLASSAAWTEMHTGVVLGHGVFNVILGGVTPLTDALFADSSLWLGITLDTEPETAPRMRLTSVPWAMRATIADSAIATGGGEGDTTWLINGSNVYRAAGRVGIGGIPSTATLEVASTDPIPMRVTTTDQTARFILEGANGGSLRASVGATNKELLCIATSSVQTGAFLSLTGNTLAASGAGLGGALLSTAYESSGGIVLRTAGVDRMIVKDTGNIGIGTSSPTTRLQVDSGSDVTLASGTGYVVVGPSANGEIAIDDNEIQARLNGAAARLNLQAAGGDVALVAGTTGGNVGIGTASPQRKLDVVGTARVQVLEITGADLVESFDMSHGSNEPGTVVAIDANAPGRLRQSSEPYDRKVAGVVSGAGGVAAGIHMGSGGSLDGATPVAMTGRVYTKCTAANGAIIPGDLLTTSSRPGYAMKATDRELAPGAVIGKAMTALESGEGLVLVLVNLQ